MCFTGGLLALPLQKIPGSISFGSEEWLSVEATDVTLCKAVSYAQAGDQHTYNWGERNRAKKWYL